jgi:hypothetical protein
MDDVEHKQLFDSIRAAQPINNGHQLRLGSALAIKAQIASYIRGMVTWHELMRPTDRCAKKVKLFQPVVFKVWASDIKISPGFQGSSGRPRWSRDQSSSRKT